MAVQISYEAWLRGRNVDASRKTFVAIGKELTVSQTASLLPCQGPTIIAAMVRVTAQIVSRASGK